MTASADDRSEHRTLTLARDPFGHRGGLSAAAIYANTQSAQLIAQLKHFLDKTHYVILISGPSGSGKSVMLRQFMGSLDSAYATLHLDAAAGLNGVELLSQVADCFANRRKKTNDINGLFKYQAERGKTPVLLIDSAELLDQRTLQLCLRLTEHGLRLILAADSELESRIGQIRDALAQAASATSPSALGIQVQRIKPFDLKNTNCYLRHQFLVAGYGGPIPFSDVELRKIHQDSKGYPGNINRAARELLQAGPKQPVSHSKEIPTRSGAGTRTVVLGVLFTLVIAVAATLYLRGKLNLSKTLGFDLPEQTEIQAQTSMPNPADTTIGTESIADKPPVARYEFELDTDAGDDKPAKAASPETESTSAPPMPGPGGVDDIDELLPQGDSFTATDFVEPEADAQDPVVSEIAAPTVPANDDNEAEPPASQSTEDRPAGAIGTANDILALNPRHYTMQIIAGRELKSIMDFVETYEIHADSAWYEIQRKQKPWYSLVYKEFESRQAALDALDSLPDALQSRKPWIRRLSAIQDSIRESSSPE